MAENRAKYQVQYKNGNIEIKFGARQYNSQSGWVDNLLPISKKTKTRFIYPIADRIRKLVEEGAASGSESVATNDSPKTLNRAA